MPGQPAGRQFFGRDLYQEEDICLVVDSRYITYIGGTRLESLGISWLLKNLRIRIVKCAPRVRGTTLQYGRLLDLDCA